MSNAMWIGLGAVVLISVATVALGARARINELHSIVFDHLDNAAENGHFAKGEYLDALSPDEITYDLIMYAELCGGYQIDELTPYVREWLQRRERA